MSDETIETLRSVSLLSGLSDTDLASLVDRADVIEIADGEYLFREGDPGDAAYVLFDGVVEILKSSGTAEVHLADRGVGEVIGEIALLLDETRSASVRAKGPASFLMIRRAQLDELMNASVTAAHALYGTILERWRNTESKLRHSARMAQLGTLSAGLAHELNNPAAAMESAAARLPEALRRRDEAAAAIVALDLDETTRQIMDRIREASSSGPALSGLERMDREDAIEDLCRRMGIPDPGRLAQQAVALKCTADDVEELAASLDGSDVGAVVAFLATDQDLAGLFADLQSGASRISDLVGAMKRHSFLDQAPIQVVDVVRQIRDTLVILSTKLEGITVDWQIEDGVPEIEAAGSELGQVWTILLDNAAYAIREAGRDPGRILIRVTPEREGVRVEIEDDGTGIPADARDRVFDPFFTTKPPGSGPGLGLHSAHSIVAENHNGTISVESGEGWTRFTVDLPGGS